jgi:hypothetical protein
MHCFGCIPQAKPRHFKAVSSRDHAGCHGHGFVGLKPFHGILFQ